MSAKWKHCPHANLVDSCNENLPSFGITKFALAGGWPQERGARAELGVNARRDLGPCYFPVMVLLF